MKPTWRARHDRPYVTLIGAVEESEDMEMIPVYMGFDGGYIHYPIASESIVLLLSAGIDLSALKSHLATIGMSSEQWLDDMKRARTVAFLGGGIQDDLSALDGIGIIFTGEVLPRSTGALETQLVVGVDGEITLSANLIKLLLGAGTDSIESLIQRVCRDGNFNKDDTAAELIQNLPELLFCGVLRLCHQASENSR